MLSKRYRVFLNRVGLVAGIFCCLSILCPAKAAYPERPIKLVVPYTAGGPADSLARYIASQMTQQLGQSVVVENKPGAGLVIGAEYVAKASPDGYTLLVAASSMFIATEGLSRTPIDNLNDFAPITLIGSLPLLLVTSPSFEAQNVQSLLTYLRAHPSEVNYASSGTGSLLHLAGELLLHTAKLQAIHIPYKGVNLAMTDLAAGRVQFSFAGAPVALPLVEAGRLKAIGVSGSQRLSTQPNIPTIAEQGLPGFEVISWYGIVTPKGTPETIVQLLYRTITDIMKTPELKEKWFQWGTEANFSNSPADLEQLMRRDMKKWSDLAQAKSFKLN